MSDWYDSEMDWKWNLENIWGKLTAPFTNRFWWIVKSTQYAWFLRKDFDWDYSYILLLLQYKLKRTRKRILANNFVVASDEIAAQIKHTEDLIQNWYDDNFTDDLQAAHDKKWGPIKIDNSKHDNQSGSMLRVFKMSREKATTPELEKQEEQEQRKIRDIHEERKEKNFDIIFAQMREYIQNWWD